MVESILAYFGTKSRQFIQKWQYLLLQEKCRLCQRCIHPFIKNMDFRYYVPPSVYFVGQEEIISDAICQLCSKQIAFGQPFINVYPYTNTVGLKEELCVASGAVFKDPINTIIYRFKYDSDVLLAKDLAYLMLSAGNMLKERIEALPASTYLVPVPLHRKRFKQRGFNQSELLAWRLSPFLNIKMEADSLKRIRNTASQQESSKSERKKNVVGAFHTINKTAFVDKHIILIDDVCTSGSTLIECAQAAKAAGALSVCALTIAFVP
jgi:ComF family protein